MRNKQIFGLFVLSFLSFNVFSQGLVQEALKAEGSKHEESNASCGSYDFLKLADKEEGVLLNASNNLMEVIQHRVQHEQKLQKKQEVLTIPVVFHVVYDNDEENIHDSVLTNQIKILNESFRRQNSDTSNLRPAFKELVGDAHIEFQLATHDPDGRPVDGYTRTKTSVEYFGGVLPFGQGQRDSINKWVADSLLYNMFRITKTNLGGRDPWDTKRYLNVWVGDYRIYEPKFNNFEEIVYLGLSTPPFGHQNWPDTVIKAMESFNEGILLQYQVVGPNNPAKFTGAYSAFNGLVNTGKMMVHEAGHYLGLRHVWGDGDCSHDDYCDDTPRAHASSNYQCNAALNTCKDTINGVDLPNMIENYMDYSTADCQNSFTKMQISIMREVINLYRGPLVSVDEVEHGANFTVYPNPAQRILNVFCESPKYTCELFDSHGRKLLEERSLVQKLIIDVSAFESGVYLLKIGQSVKRIVVE